MTRTCGKEFGLCRLQISPEILFGGLVETLYHQRKIWFDVPSSQTPHETGVPWLRKILCTLYELAPNWMLSGLILSYGILGAKLSSKISSNSQHGCSSMPRIQICLPQLLEPSGINETIFDYTKCCTTDQLSRVSKDHYEEFKAISPARTPKPWQTRVTWKPPPLDSFKINYDVAVFTENNNFGTVVIN